jgi:hypothetical protein
MSLIHSLKGDGDGYTHVADDGIARKYDSKGKVVDAVRLTNTHLMGIALQMANKEDQDHLKDVWGKINSRNVADEHVWEPPHHIKPLEIQDPDLYASKLQSPNPEKRGNPIPIIPPPGNPNRFCEGKECSSDSACQFMGCQGCALLDMYTQKVCV